MKACDDDDEGALWDAIGDHDTAAAAETAEKQKLFWVASDGEQSQREKVGVPTDTADEGEPAESRRRVAPRQPAERPSMQQKPIS